MRIIASYCEGDDEESQIERAELRRLINMLFAVARQHLELEPRLRDLSLPTMSMVTPNEARVLKRVRNRVPIVAQWFSFRLNESVRAGRFTKHDMRAIEEHIGAFVASWMAADKVAHTPLPYPYVQMLNLLLLIFVFTAPFTFANRFGGFTPAMSFLLAFALLGINAVASEIENPFGTDANDLPLDTYAQTVEEDTELILRQRDPDTEKYEKFWGRRALHQRLVREQAEQEESTQALPLAQQADTRRRGSRGRTLARSRTNSFGSLFGGRGAAPRVGSTPAAPPPPPPPPGAPAPLPPPAVESTGGLQDS